MTPWTGDEPDAMRILPENSTKHKDENKHPFLERDSKARSLIPSDQDSLDFSSIKWKCVSASFTFVCACGKIEGRKMYSNIKLRTSESKRL
jgi:hypothetical protein